MKKLIFISFILFLANGCATNNSEQIVSISLNLDDAKEITYEEISPLKKIYLDSSKPEYFLAIVAKIIDTGDSYIFASREKVSKFGKDGKFITNFSEKGNAENEYSSIYNCNIIDNNVHILDLNSKKSLIFNLGGEYIETIQYKDGANFEKRIEFNGGYIAKNFMLGDKSASELMFIGKDKSSVKIGDEKFIGPMGMTNEFSAYNGNINHVDMLDYTVYSIDTNLNVKQKYFIDLMKYGIPDDVRAKPTREIFEYISENDIAILYPEFIETDDHLLLKASKSQTLYLCKYNKKDKTSKIYSFNQNIDQEDVRICNLTFVSEDKIVILLENENTNLSMCYLEI